MGKIFSFIILFSLLFIANACKKDKVSPEESSTNSKTLTLENTELESYQLVVAHNANLVESENVFIGIIDEIPVNVHVKDSIVIFMVPKVVGSNLTLKVKIDNKDYESAKFSVQKAVVESSEIEFNNQFNVFDELKTRMTTLIDSLSLYPNLEKYSADLYQDIAAIQSYTDEIENEFNSLSEEEKKMVAEVIAANEEYFEELKLAINSPSIELYKFFEKGGGVSDVFGNVKPHLIRFTLNSSLTVLFGALGYESFHLPIPNVNLVLGGVFTIATAYVVIKAAKELKEIVNISWDAIDESFSFLKSDLTFESESVYPMDISTKFVSIYSGTNFTSSLMTKFKNGASLIATNWNKVAEYIPFISSIPVVEKMSSPLRTSNYAVHAKYLTISDVSNSKVSVYQVYNENGVLKLGFKTTSAADENFTFKLTYSTEINGFSKTISASIIGLGDDGGSDNGNNDGESDDVFEPETIIHKGLTYITVLNPTTGKIWLDRNLGATQAGTGENSYGDLYQWGRKADGHQKRWSDTTSVLSHSDTPGHNKFIITPNVNDWRSPYNNNLWQGVNGINNPCPTGFRLPTDTEFKEERDSWTSNDALGAMNSVLKLPIAGWRSIYGKLGNDGMYDTDYGHYWTSSIYDNFDANYLDIPWTHDYTYPPVLMSSTYHRSLGASVRCIKD